MSYQCYGCQKVCKYHELAYECTCYHSKSPSYRGICKVCREKGEAIAIPPSHDLKKVSGKISRGSGTA